MTLTGCRMRDRTMMVMVAARVPPVEVLLAVVVMVVWPAEAEARLCVTTVTKLGILLGIVRTQLRHVGIAERLIMHQEVLAVDS